MKTVGRRLGKADVGTVTQVIEGDIIASLKDMIEALSRAQKKDPVDGPRKPRIDWPEQPRDPKLIDLLAELKMIRAMQLRVNGRTKAYGETYDGEQADNPDIQRELQNLSRRQLRIVQVTNEHARAKTP